MGSVTSRNQCPIGSQFTSEIDTHDVTEQNSVTAETLLKANCYPYSHSMYKTATVPSNRRRAGRECLVLSADFCFPHASPAFQVEFVIVFLSEIKVDTNEYCWAELLLKGSMVKLWHIYEQTS